MRRCLPAIVALIWCLPAFALDAQSKHAVNFTGHWTLNAVLSEDPEKMLQAKLMEERREIERMRRREESMVPQGAPPPIAIDTPPPSREIRPWRKQQLENFRKMLGVTPTLDINRQASAIEIISAVEVRRLVPGSRTQVSMPEGQLADSNVGWDGEWFVIERKVRKGPRVVEKFRVMKKTGQLEYTMAWSGDTELAGIKARRVFDRAAAPASAPNPNLDPVR